MFAGVSPEDRLDPTDAQFVDVLHTDMNCKHLNYRMNTETSRIVIAPCSSNGVKENTLRLHLS